MKKYKLPQKIEGAKAFDLRGSLSFVNDFSFRTVKRFYLIDNFKNNFVRAWHGHKYEEKFFYCISGAAQVACVEISNYKKPSKNKKIFSWVLTENKSEIIYIPKGYANGSMNLKENTKLLVFSTSTLEQSSKDDYRYPANYWNPWKIENR